MAAALFRHAADLEINGTAGLGTCATRKNPAVPSRSIFSNTELIRRWIMGVMRRTLALILAALVAIALFVELVYAVLVAAHVSEPAATTVYGLTPRRLWATTVAVVALISVIIGGLALIRPTGRFGTASGRLGAILALVMGLIAVINGWLNLAIATGGPGSGNGVVGAAGALVLGLIGLVLGGLALARRIRAASGETSLSRHE
jgi:hypothetical protein